MDITTGWEEGGLTKLCLHPGVDKVNDNWPSVIFGNTPKVEDAVFADMNNDGLLDIVSCTEGNSKKIFVHWAPDARMIWMYTEPIELVGRNGVDLLATGNGPIVFLGWFEASLEADELFPGHGIQSHQLAEVRFILKRDMDFYGDLML